MTAKEQTQVDSVYVCAGTPPNEITQMLPSAAAVGLLRSTRAYHGPCATLGSPVLLGGGRFKSSVQRVPAGLEALGVVFDGEALELLPINPHDGARCLDLSGDREIQVQSECVGGHERVLFLPPFDLTPPVGWTSDKNPLPFKWVLLNWNPAGHPPLGAWGMPHFDFHFFIQSLADRNTIRMGECAMLVSCEDLEEGSRSPDPRFIPEGFVDRGVVEFGMGKHLIPDHAPEFNGEWFTHTLVYGVWKGSISFIEPMVTYATFIELRRSGSLGGCYDIPQPEAVESGGLYPTRYCVRYRPARDEFLVSIEGFELRG